MRPQGLSQRPLSSGHAVVYMGQMACWALTSAWHLYRTSSDKASFLSAKQHQTQQRKTKMLCHMPTAGPDHGCRRRLSPSSVLMSPICATLPGVIQKMNAPQSFLQCDVFCAALRPMCVQGRGGSACGRPITFQKQESCFPMLPFGAQTCQKCIVWLLGPEGSSFHIQCI